MSIQHLGRFVVVDVAVVTGASRGAGKGIAIALGESGATVYVTGRSRAVGDSPHGGTIAETAALVDEAGGRGIAVPVDHGDDEAVAALFARVKRDHGRLDVLVNNAAKVGAPGAGGFWEKPLETAALYAAEDLMAYSGRALIGAELGARLGVTDLDGSAPLSLRDTLGAPPELHPSLR
jgi:NAD(P)-dependent dehydrogenase (short-subunit alcohol dehydrogenase family)